MNKIITEKKFETSLIEKGGHFFLHVPYFCMTDTNGRKYLNKGIIATLKMEIRE